MLQAWQDAILTQVVEEAPEVKRFSFSLETEAPFEFVPGQFIKLDLPIHKKRRLRWRSYSIASAPSNKSSFELLVVRVADGLGSNYLFNDLSIGDKVSFQGPQGNFCLPNELQKNLCFICTGTGIAPFRSMILDLFKRNVVKDYSINLIFGTRTEKDILFKEELEQLAMEEENFNFYVALSREKNEAYQHGYVHEVYQNLHKPGEKLSFYVCGWQKMIDDTVSNLTAAGWVLGESVFIESYGQLS